MNETIPRDVLSKVPEVTLVFWIIKIAATTLGETGGDTVTMTLDWGYLAGSALFLISLVVLVAMQILARRFQPVLYWLALVGRHHRGQHRERAEGRGVLLARDHLLPDARHRARRLGR